MNKDNTGVLFGQDEVKTDKHPTHTGTALVDGKEYQLSAWINTSKKGKKYLSLKFNEPKARAEVTNTTPAPVFDKNEPF